MKAFNFLQKPLFLQGVELLELAHNVELLEDILAVLGFGSCGAEFFTGL